ncbi:MAG: PDZ domain-containing protein [Proteobacteria bacterium]|nr:PDZ domain-containing protein [Pseudomonadota bacterium]
MDALFGAAAAPSRPEKWMTRHLKPIAVGVALVCALVLTVTRPQGPGRLGFDRPHAALAGASRAGGTDLGALKVFERVLLRVTDDYVEPERIRPREMLLAALHGVERDVAEVLVRESSDKGRLAVRVQDVERSFDIRQVDSPWNLSAVMRTILRFIQPHLQPTTELGDVEYAAINGMLSTLDPHSVLLEPDVYNEMRLSTRGEFGGLGIVISMIQGALTVIKPMPGTPAEAVGLKPCDQILKIGQESTVNMTLTQAVQRLRGAPGTSVVITIQRQGSPRPARKTLRRDVIKVDSVISRMLPGNVGHVVLNSFQGNSEDDLRQHLRRLKQQGMKALVLDLRDNPGGLLDQAVKIADLFIESGTLVTTVSHAGRHREEKRAQRDQTEERYPIAVLVNNGSASASEIVAGALKHLDRAVVIGRRTFGKGSVQVLYDNDDGSALKLTIAQYLTPGDISIQSVGITPDVATMPVVVRDDLIRLRRRDASPREDGLSQHLTHSSARREEAAFNLRFLRESPDEGHPAGGGVAPPAADGAGKNVCLFPQRECRAEAEDKFVEDFQIALARQLLSQAPGWRRSQVLGAAGPLFAKVQADEDQRIGAALTRLGVDWSLPGSADGGAGPVSGAAPRLAVQVQTTPAGEAIEACTRAKIKVTVRNEGRAPAYRLAAHTESSDFAFRERELVFGRLDPGQTRSWVLPIEVPDLPTRLDEVTLRFADAGNTSYPPHSFQLALRGAKRPVFAYAYQLIDDLEGGNRDGRAQRGERVRLFVKVRNTGAGAALRAVTTLQNLSGVGIFIRKGRFLLDRMEPGQASTASFTLEVEPGFREDGFKLDLAVFDEGLQEAVSEKLQFAIAPASAAEQPASGAVRVSATGAPVRAWGASDAPLVGQAKGGTILRLLGRDARGVWDRVEVGPERSAFIAAKDTAVDPGPPRGQFDGRWQVTPPRLVLEVPTLATDKSSLRIAGEARDETRVADIYVFVRNRDAKIEARKVYYQSNAHATSKQRLRFATEVPLWLGANYVTVFARENNDVQTQQVAVIMRREGGRQVAERVQPEDGQAGPQ